MQMEITFDPAKNAENIRKRGLAFERASDFDFETAAFWQDTRKAYPEIRISALGMIGDRLHSLVFTETPQGIRVISLRKANTREAKRYERETQS